jgi:hypothetical protein
VGLAAGSILTAFSRRFSTSPGIPALLVSEFSACRPVIPTADIIFINGFEP